MIIENKFQIGQMVYLSVREEKVRGMVTGLFVFPQDLLMYQVSWENGDGGDVDENHARIPRSIAGSRLGDLRIGTVL